MAGVARALKGLKPDVTIGLADPTGSALYNFYKNGELKVEGTSISEGIGNSRITDNLEGTAIDVPYQIPDEESVPLVYDMIRREGLALGGSSGVNVAGAIRLARELGPGHVIVTLLCDSAMRYRQRLFNREYLAERGLELPDWLHLDG